MKPEQSKIKMGEWTYVRDESPKAKQSAALKRMGNMMSKRNEDYGKAMEGAFKDAEKKGTLGVGFGGEKPEKVKPMKAPPVVRVGKQGFKASRY